MQRFRWKIAVHFEMIYVFLQTCILPTVMPVQRLLLSPDACFCCPPVEACALHDQLYSVQGSAMWGQAMWNYTVCKARQGLHYKIRLCALAHCVACTQSAAAAAPGTSPPLSSSSHCNALCNVMCAMVCAMCCVQWYVHCAVYNGICNVLCTMVFAMCNV